MARGLWGKIEWVREQPEHVRMRYVLGSLFVSMLFILGIWFLSLTENFQNISRDVPMAAQKGRELIPEGAPSLSGLLEQAVPLEAGKQDQKTGEEYFNEQFSAGAEKNSEGVTQSPTTP